MHSQYVIPIHPEGISFDLKNSIKNNEVIVEGELLNRMSQLFVEDLITICSPECIRVQDTKVLVRIRTNSADSDITWETDESYYLNVNTTGKISQKWSFVRVFFRYRCNNRFSVISTHF